MKLAIFLVWLLVLASPTSFDEKMDRLKVFYCRRSWRLGRTTA